MYCPGCGEWGAFNTRSFTNVAGKAMSWTNDYCLNCQQKVMFIAVDPDLEEIDSQTDIGLYAYPAPERIRSPLSGLTDVDEFDERLQRAYRSAIKAYNHRDWGGAVVHGRRVLEGISLKLLPDEHSGSGLFEQLEKLPNEVDLGEPIIGVAHAIRKGGNLGAHFDQELETDEETARLVLDLLDELLEYLLVTPGHIEDLIERVSGETP